MGMLLLIQQNVYVSPDPMEKEKNNTSVPDPLAKAKCLSLQREIMRFSDRGYVLGLLRLIMREGQHFDVINVSTLLHR